MVSSRPQSHEVGGQASSSRVPFWLLLGCVLVALIEGRRAVAGVSTPYDFDHFRDVASAQSILDGNFPADPAYRGETIWYNPLLPAIVALVSWLSRAEVSSVYVQIAPWLNVLGPISFFAMARMLFGAWPALLATVSLIFAPPYYETPWATPTYSPWLFPANFAPTFFYFGLLLTYQAMHERSAASWLVAGVGLGVTFLAHTAPAVILGICVVVAALGSGAGEGSNQRQVRVFGALALSLGAAVVVSLPLLSSIVGHYHLRILNPAPNNWQWPDIDRAHLSSLARASLNVKNVLAGVGFVICLRQCRRIAAARLMVVWFITALTLFGYSLLQQSASFQKLPPFLPNYHAYVYLQNAGHVFVGVAVWWLLGHAVARFRRRTEEAHDLNRLQGALAGALVLVFVLAALPFYHRRSDAVGVRGVALNVSKQRRAFALTENIRRLTPPGSVILASPEDSVLHVAPADRQAVALVREFSNPYVAYEPRAAAHQALFAALFSSTVVQFDELARRNGVTHVLLDPASMRRFDELVPKPTGFRELFRSEGGMLLAVR